MVESGGRGGESEGSLLSILFFPSSLDTFYSDRFAWFRIGRKVAFKAFVKPSYLSDLWEMDFLFLFLNAWIIDSIRSWKREVYYNRFQMVSIKLLNYKIPLVLGFICYFVLISFFFLLGNYSRLREYVPCLKLVQWEHTDKHARRLKINFLQFNSYCHSTLATRFTRNKNGWNLVGYIMPCLLHDVHKSHKSV